MTAPRQRTLAVVTRALDGRGLHGGKPSRVTLEPAAASTGLVFRREDLGGAPVIPARAANIVPSERCTSLSFNGVPVRVVEHALAACVLAGLDNAVLAVEGEELPAADGSAEPFLDMIMDAGLVEQDEERPVAGLREPVELRGAATGGGLSWTVRAEPADRLACVFRFLGAGSLAGAEEAFVPGADDPRALARARTFCFEREIAGLLARGLGAGGDAGNVLVIRDDGSCVNPERVPHEPVLHKLLDLVGDLALAGTAVAARITAEGTGHRAHAELLRILIPKLTSARPGGALKTCLT